MQHIRSKLRKSLTVMPDTIHNRTWIPVGNAHHRTNIHIRRHIEGTVRIAGYGRTQYCRVIMFIKQREFQCIVEKILVVINIQIFTVHIIRRNAVQFLQERSLRFCDMKLPAKRFPSRHFDGIHMEILTAVKHNNNGCIRKPVCLCKHAGIVTCNIVAAADTAENLNVLPNILQTVAKLRGGTFRNSKIHLNRLYPGIFFRLLHNLRRNLIHGLLCHIVLENFKSGRQQFKVRTHHRDVSCQLAVNDIPARGTSYVRYIVKTLLNRIRHLLNDRRFQYLRINLKHSSPRTAHPVRIFKFQKFLLKALFFLINKPDLLHTVPRLSP